MYLERKSMYVTKIKFVPDPGYDPTDVHLGNVRDIVSKLEHVLRTKELNYARHTDPLIFKRRDCLSDWIGDALFVLESLYAGGCYSVFHGKSSDMYGHNMSRWIIVYGGRPFLLDVCFRGEAVIKYSFADKVKLFFKKPVYPKYCLRVTEYLRLWITEDIGMDADLSVTDYPALSTYSITTGVTHVGIDRNVRTKFINNFRKEDRERRRKLLNPINGTQSGTGR